MSCISAKHYSAKLVPRPFMKMLYWVHIYYTDKGGNSFHKYFESNPKIHKGISLLPWNQTSEVTWSLKGNKMLQVSTWSILVRFQNCKWGLGKDFVKSCCVKQCLGDGGSSSTNWITCLVWVQLYNHVAKSDLRKNFVKDAKIIQLS